MFRCILCKELSFSIICTTCQSSLLIPSIKHRNISHNHLVYSFYRYSEVDSLLKTKYSYLGASIYKILAKNTFYIFAKKFQFPNVVYVFGVDDTIKHGYSHTAILAKSMKTDILQPIFGSMRAKNSIRYAGKSLDFRLKNPREFQYSFKDSIDAILVDDIITTGSTLQEAKTILEKYNVNVLFSLTIADAKES